MGKYDDNNLRTKCLRKCFLRSVGNGKCLVQDLIKQLNTGDAPSHCAQAFTESAAVLKKQPLATLQAKQKIAVEIPSSKRSLEVDSQTFMPRKKKRRILRSSIHTPTRNNPTSDLAVLPQIKMPVSQKCQLMPVHVSLLYAEAQRILLRAKMVIEKFLGNKDYDFAKCNANAPTLETMSALDDSLVFKEIASFRERHDCKKFYNRNLLIGQRLKAGIERSNEYLSTLRQAIKILPVYPHPMKKLISKFNKVFLWYKVNLVHGQYKTVCRNLVLVKTLITKFNNKHGLTTNFVPNRKK